MILSFAAGLMLALAPEQAAAPATQPAVQPPVEKQICRRQGETGSLVKAKKVCMTAKQWSARADGSREEIERTVSMGSASGQ